MKNETLHKKAKMEQKKRTKKLKPKKSNKHIILIVGSLVLLSIIVFTIYWSVTNKSILGQVNDLDKAIVNKNYDKVSEMLKVEGRPISKSESKHLVDYLNKPENKKRYNKEINQIRTTIKNNTHSDSEIGRITDKNKKPIITISRDGIKYFIFKKVAFKPHYRAVYIKNSGNQSTYEYEYANKKEKAITNGKHTKLGHFIVGNYNLPSTKTFDESDVGNDSSVDGNIHINTDKINNDEHIYAKDNFSQSWFKVKLKNTNHIDKNYKLYVDDTEIEYQKNKIYGKFPSASPIIVKATGRLNNATISTNEVEVQANTNNKPQEITLKFDDKQIKKEMDKSKKTSEKAKEFLKKYTNQLNHSYKTSDFDNLADYFEDDKSDIAKNIKKQVESKKESHFEDIKFEKSKTKDNEVTVIMNKKNEKKKRIRSQYVLKYNEENKEFKIKEYTDI